MILLIDIGNSNIVVAKHNSHIHDSTRFTTDKTKSIDEYYSMMKDLLKDIDAVVISSVVPELNIIMRNVAQKYLNLTPIFVGPGVKTGVRIIVDNPKEVGSDLVSDAAGAIQEYSDTSIVVDMGTATTVTYIENKVIKGVSILAGLITQRDALIGNTSQLSQFAFDMPKELLGTNTVDALNSGLLYSHVFTIIGYVDALKKEYNTEPRVIITGGASRFIEGLLPDDYVVDEYLLVKGLYTIYQKNK